LEREGYEVTYLPVDEDGLISIEQLQDAIKETTILITVMYAQQKSEPSNRSQKSE
jgi:cysteine desulfurase